MKTKTKYQTIPVEISEDIKGMSIADVRVTKSADGPIQRVALLFEDGAVLAIEGRWPANAFLETTEEAFKSLHGTAFEGVTCRACEPGPAIDTRYEQKVLIELCSGGQTLEMGWVAVGYTDYYEEFFPRFEFRAAPEWGQQPVKGPQP